MYPVRTEILVRIPMACFERRRSLPCQTNLLRGDPRARPRAGGWVERLLVGWPPTRQLLHLRITLEHGRQRDIQHHAYFEQARCADTVHAFFVFLNLLIRDAQFFADLVLAHIERQPVLVHSRADIRVDGGCASRCEFSGLCFSHRFDLPHKILGALYQKAAITYLIGSKMTVKNGLYSIRIAMKDGGRGHATGIIVLLDGQILGGDSHFYYTGTYTFKNGKWRGELTTYEHTKAVGLNMLFGGREVNCGFTGKYTDGEAEVSGTALVGKASILFEAVLNLKSPL
jgi:hypothetical protein